MAGLKGRYFSDRDIRFINSINRELLDNVVQTQVTIFKSCPEATAINIYSESSQKEGKHFYPGIDITAWIDRADIATDADDFGPNRKQNVAFKFRELALKQINFFPETGDLILFNERYHEVDEVVQEQFLSGVPEKSFSIIVNTHYSRLSSKDIVIRQS